MPETLDIPRLNTVALPAVLTELTFVRVEVAFSAGKRFIEQLMIHA